MQVENHKEGVPFEYYVNLFKDLDPQEASARTGASFDGQAFTLRLVFTISAMPDESIKLSADMSSSQSLGKYSSSSSSIA